MEKENTQKNKEVKFKTLEKEMQFYDNMIKTWNKIPENSNMIEKMQEKGLIAKAIQYYNASGKGYEKECQELEDWVKRFTEEEIKKDNYKIYVDNLENPEFSRRHMYLETKGLNVLDLVPKYMFELELNKEIGTKN